MTQEPARRWHPSRPPVLSHAPVIAEVGGLLGVSPGDLFAFISDPLQLRAWRRSVFRVSIDDTNAARPGRVGSTRILKPLLFGRTTRETILSWRRPYILSFAVRDGVTAYQNRIDVLSLDSDGISSVRFRWLVHAQPTGSRLTLWWATRDLQNTLDHGWRKLQRRYPYR